jgi:mannosyltransferase
MEGETGFLVKTGDVAGLAGAMVRMSADREAARAMGARGRAMCLERFSAEAMVAGIEAVYGRLMGRA